jgi:hypothetical protein
MQVTVSHWEAKQLATGFGSKGRWHGVPSRKESSEVRRLRSQGDCTLVELDYLRLWRLLVGVASRNASSKIETECADMIRR